MISENFTKLIESLVCPNYTWENVVSKDALHLLIFPCPRNVTGECLAQGVYARRLGWCAPFGIICLQQCTLRIIIKGWFPKSRGGHANRLCSHSCDCRSIL